MKNSLIFLMFCFLAFSLSAQQITELDEARIKVSAVDLQPTNVPDQFRYIVKEDFSRDFTKDPLAFVKNNFDVYSLIEEIDNPDYNTFIVRFESSKGYLQADYNYDGRLLNTYQNFENVALPVAVRNEMYLNNRGWSMVANSYKARSKGDKLTNEKFRIKMENGNKSKIVKIDPAELKEERMAGL